jgi:hypothetical protein
MSDDSALRHCPVSRHILRKPAVLSLMPNNRSIHLVECPFCGDFVIERWLLFPLNALLEVPNEPSRLSRKQVVLSHALRRMDVGDDRSLLTRELIDRILREDRLPSLLQQQDNLLIWLEKETDVDGRYQIDFDGVGGIIGSSSRGTFIRVLEEMVNRGLLVGDGAVVGLSYGGLERLEELRRTTASGFDAFIAMKFNDPTLDDLVDNYLRPAVLQTGFHLFRVNDRPEAGLIDAKLRNDIRQARFVIVDETHANLGAYWEAGYAEGLGKPVIYTCEKSVFDGTSKDGQAPHFDTNHHTTILWEKGAFPQAAEKLKQTIRFTIPEARQRDE